MPLTCAPRKNGPRRGACPACPFVPTRRERRGIDVHCAAAVPLQLPQHAQVRGRERDPRRFCQNCGNEHEVTCFSTPRLPAAPAHPPTWTCHPLG